MRDVDSGEVKHFLEGHSEFSFNQIQYTNEQTKSVEVSVQRRRYPRYRDTN